MLCSNTWIVRLTFGPHIFNFIEALKNNACGVGFIEAWGTFSVGDLFVCGER